jgi:DNA-3-methyladenine glycosylase II
MTPEYQKARRHLARRDPVLKELIRQVGPCTLQLHPDRFITLVRSIVSQQISTKAAASIYKRLEASLKPKRVRPATLVAVSEKTLREAGLSEAKARSVLDLAQKVHRKEVPLDKLHELDDEEAIQSLIPVRGIGRWTAEMFLMFCLGRPDVLPVADLGLRVGVQRQFGLAEQPGRAELEKLAEPWRPYRSIATWYMWRSLGFVPQSEPGNGEK